MLSEIAKHVESMISYRRGDRSRLTYILKKLRHNKTLYNTDQKYLDALLNKYPIGEKEEPFILKETFTTADLNQEIKAELRFAYDAIEVLQNKLNQLKKTNAAKIQQLPAQGIIDQSLEAQEEHHVPSISTPSNVMLIEPKISVDAVIRYARQCVIARRGGLFKKHEIYETPLAWEKFLYPYYDNEIEITFEEIEKTKSKNDSITKTIRYKATIDGRTGAIVDITKEGISYRYSFLNDLSTDETSVLYYVSQIQSFTLNEISGMRLPVEKLAHVLKSLTEKGHLKRNGWTGKYQLNCEIPNPSKLKCFMDEYGIIQKTSTERRIKPSITVASLPFHLGKYWSRCHVPASMLVYYPFYGITYNRKDYYRIEVIDGVTGKRQPYLEHIVTIRPQNKIEGAKPKIEIIPQKV